MTLPLLPFAAAFHYGLIHRCHRWANYDAYDRSPLESSYGAMDRRLPYFECIFGNLMRNPGPEELEALLPANWIKAQESSSQTIEVEVA